MDLFVYNDKYELLGMFQNPVYYLYVEQLRGKGEFEVSLPLTDENIQLSSRGNVVCFDFEKGIAGVINSVNVENKGNSSAPSLVVSGSLVNVYLYRRICWGLYTFNGKPLKAVNDMLDKHVVNPQDKKRAISDIELEEPDDVGESISYQNTGKNVGESIEALCATVEAGFYLKFYPGERKMKFKAYKGVDRTISQQFVPPVVISQSFESLMSSVYDESDADHKNVALVAGEGEGTDRVMKQVGEVEGKNRIELFVDAREIQSTNDDGSVIPKEEYESMLEQKGTESLSELQVAKSFSCGINTQASFQYGVDFFLGDKVSVNDEQSGVMADAIVSEAEHVFDSKGYSLNITFGFEQLTLVKKMKVLGVS